MKRKTMKNAKGKRTAAAPEKVKAVRDNVLGRRPSKSDPLGEQPGTITRNPELAMIKGEHRTVADAPGPRKRS